MNCTNCSSRFHLRNAMSYRRGQTLIEILIVAAIMVILGALSMELLRPSTEEKIQGAVRMFAQDVEWPAAQR